MILGHERQARYFDRVMAADRMSHAYLLHGPDRVGKRAMAYAIARSLLCPQYKKGSQSIADAGDDCRVCREIDAGTHPGFVLLDRIHTLVSDKEMRSEIPIEDIRELKRRFAFAAVGDAWRIAIIDGIDTMSRDAEVAFLKLLEEPGIRTLFLLVASSRDAVPPTIVSRATPVLFAPVPDAALVPYIRAHVPKENIEDIRALAEGRPGMIVEWVQDPRKFAEEKKFAAFFAGAFAGGIAGALALSEKAADDEVMRRGSQYAWIAHLRRRLGAASGAERMGAAHRIARALDLAGVMDDTNVNVRLALDVMFVEAVSSPKISG